MKTLIAVLAVFLLVNSSSHSQGRLKEKPDNAGGEFFSISYDIGYNYTSNSREIRSVNRFGQAGSVELAFHSSGRNQFFISVGEQKLISGKTYIEPVYLTSVTFGPRIFLFPKSRIFAEASFGPYFLSRYYGSSWGNIGNELTPPSNTSLQLGVSLGAGKEFVIANTSSLLLKAVLRNVFAEVGDIAIFGLYSSFQFNNKTASANTRLSAFEPHWAFTVLAGTNNPDFFVNNLFEWGHNYGIEAARVHSPRMEFYTSLANNRFVRLFSSPELQQSYPWKEYCLTFAVGEKMYFNDKTVSPYLDLGAGAFFFYYLENETGIYHSSRSGDPAIGVSAGTGIKIRLNKSFSIVAGSKGLFGLGIGIGQNSSNDAFSFLTINSGLRLDL